MDTEGRDRDDYGKVLRTLGPLLGSGIQLAASVLVMFFIGWWLDSRYGTTPWLMIAGMFLGFGAGLTSFIRTVNEIGRKKAGGER